MAENNASSAEQKKVLPEEDFLKPRGDLTPSELKFICNICQIAKNKRSVGKVECERTEGIGTYCRLINNLRLVYLTQARELELCQKYVSLFMGERVSFRKDELKQFFDEKADKSKQKFEEFLNFCRINGMDVLE